MTIASALSALNQDIQDARTAITSKGGTVTVDGGSSQLATDIATIPSGGTIDSLTIIPTTSSQTITASGGTDGYSPITVNAVTSSIDANITAGNIRKDVTILGVTGSYEGGSSGYSEFPRYQVINGVASKRSGALTGNEFSGITSIDNNALYQAFNDCSGLTGSVNLSSVTSIGDNGLYLTFSNCSGLTSVNLSSLASVGSYGLYQAFRYCSGLTGSVNLSSLASVGSSGLYYAFSGCTGLTSVNLSSLAIVGNYGLYYAFSGCTGLTSVNLSSLAIVGNYGLYYAFSGCTGLTSVDLSSLTTVSGGSALGNAFRNCTGLKDIYFRALTTLSFGSYTNQFNSMLYNTGTTTNHTLHFPSNLQSTIAGLTGYPLFGGTSGYVTLLFDLPATN